MSGGGPQGAGWRGRGHLVVSGGVVGQLLLEQLTQGPVLPLQVEHQHLQLDALLSQVLLRDTHRRPA